MSDAATIEVKATTHNLLTIGGKLYSREEALRIVYFMTLPTKERLRVAEETIAAVEVINAGNVRDTTQAKAALELQAK